MYIPQTGSFTVSLASPVDPSGVLAPLNFLPVFWKMKTNNRRRSQRADRNNKIRNRKPSTGFIEDPYIKLLNQLSGDVKMNLLKKELGESLKFYKELNEVRDLSGIQARLPYFIEIH